MRSAVALRALLVLSVGAASWAVAPVAFAEEDALPDVCYISLEDTQGTGYTYGDIVGVQAVLGIAGTGTWADGTATKLCDYQKKSCQAAPACPAGTLSDAVLQETLSNPALPDIDLTTELNTAATQEITIKEEEGYAQSLIPTSDAGFGAKIGDEYRCSMLAEKVRKGTMNLSDLYCYVLYALEFAIYATGSAVVLIIIYSGYQYILATFGMGDADAALGNVRKALIGLVISSFAWILVRIAEQITL